MRLRSLAVLAFPAALLLISCPAKDPAPLPPPTPPHPSAVVILLEVKTDPGIPPRIQITPNRAWISFEDQQVIWVSDGSSDEIRIEFIGPNNPPRNPKPGANGKLKHQPGWGKGEHTGTQPYKVTVTRNGQPIDQNPPELIIDF